MNALHSRGCDCCPASVQEVCSDFPVLECHGVSPVAGSAGFTPLTPAETLSHPMPLDKLMKGKCVP